MKIIRRARSTNGVDGDEACWTSSIGRYDPGSPTVRRPLLLPGVLRLASWVYQGLIDRAWAEAQRFVDSDLAASYLHVLKALECGRLASVAFWRRDVLRMFWNRACDVDHLLCSESS